jgi:5'-phosphate synthase pdxT subunit
MTNNFIPPLPSITIGVLALQGAFEEHQRAIESIISPSSSSSISISTIQIRTPHQLSQIDGIILPGGESTAMGLIGDSTDGLWDALKDFVIHNNKPTWGTCAGMILLAERCVGTSAVITKGQSLIGGVDILVCRNYFGSQISSFEMNTPPPPKPPGWDDLSYAVDKVEVGHDEDDKTTRINAPFPGVFIRAPAILTAGPDVQVLGKVVAAPCRAAAVVLRELENKIASGENVVQLGVVDALERKAGGGIAYSDVRLHSAKEETTTETRMNGSNNEGGNGNNNIITSSSARECIDLPGASDGSNAREVICAVQKGNILCTAFHPELADDDLRWHEYFVGMVLDAKKNQR